MLQSSKAPDCTLSSPKHMNMVNPKGLDWFGRRYCMTLILSGYSMVTACYIYLGLQWEKSSKAERKGEKELESGQSGGRVDVGKVTKLLKILALLRRNLMLCTRTINKDTAYWKVQTILLHSVCHLGRWFLLPIKNRSSSCNPRGPSSVSSWKNLRPHTGAGLQICKMQTEVRQNTSHYPNIKHRIARFGVCPTKF